MVKELFKIFINFVLIPLVIILFIITTDRGTFTNIVLSNVIVFMFGFAVLIFFDKFKEKYLV